MPMTANNYDKVVKKQLRATKSVAEVTMQDACDDLHVAEGAEASSIVNTAVSWFVTSSRSLISMKNGKVIDGEVMCVEL